MPQLKNKIFIIFKIVLILFSLSSRAAAEMLAKIDSVPWGISWASEREIIFTVRAGRAGLLNIENGEISWLGGVPEVYTNGQGGLLDIAKSPKHPQQFYLTYSKPTEAGAATTLARATLGGAKFTDWRDLFITRSDSDSGLHFGSRIAFDDDGHLFFSIGDRGARENGQDLTTHAGSILRLDLDGGIPPDNPFVGRANILPAIYSYGHRNPQGLCYDFERKGLWASEHGPRGGDEINWILPGKNYGWAEVSHGREYWAPFMVGEGTTRDDVEPARKIYTPSIAPGSLWCYRGKTSNPHRGDLLLGALKLRHLNHIMLDDSGRVVEERRLLENQNERIRALIEEKNGNIIYTTDSGKFIRLRTPF